MDLNGRLDPRKHRPNALSTCRLPRAGYGTPQEVSTITVHTKSKRMFIRMGYEFNMLHKDNSPNKQSSMISSFHITKPICLIFIDTALPSLDHFTRNNQRRLRTGISPLLVPTMGKVAPMNSARLQTPFPPNSDRSL
jgi:hypothetical protein